MMERTVRLVRQKAFERMSPERFRADWSRALGIAQRMKSAEMLRDDASSLSIVLQHGCAIDCYRRATDAFLNGQAASAWDLLRAAERLAWTGMQLDLGITLVSPGYQLNVVDCSLRWANLIAVGETSLADDARQSVVAAFKDGRAVHASQIHGARDPFGLTLWSTMLCVQRARTGQVVRDESWSTSTDRRFHLFRSVGCERVDTSDELLEALVSWLDDRVRDLRRRDSVLWTGDIPFVLLPIELYGFVRAVGFDERWRSILEHPFCDWRPQSEVADYSNESLGEIADQLELFSHVASRWTQVAIMTASRGPS